MPKSLIKNGYRIVIWAVLLSFFSVTNLLAKGEGVKKLVFERFVNFDTKKAKSLTLKDDYLYVSNGSGGIVVIDVSNKTYPKKLLKFDTSDKVYEVKIDGNYAYAANGGGGLLIIDVSDKTRFEKIAKTSVAKKAVDVDYKNGYVYIADKGDSLITIDARDKIYPRKISSVKISVSKIEVSGDYLYAGTDKGMVVFDIKEEGNPKLIGEYKNFKKTKDIFIKGDYAYLAEGEYGIEVLDISDKRRPKKAAFYKPDGKIVSLFCEDGYLYAADSEGEIKIFRAEGDYIEPVSSFETEGKAKKIFVKDKTVYIAEGKKGVEIGTLSEKNRFSFDFSGFSFLFFISYLMF